MTYEDLKKMRAWPLERKIRVTQTRIIEWYQRFDGKVYISFSGGKDSTVLLDLARRIYPDIKAVFSDTGLEYPEIKEFVKKSDNITIIRPEISFREIINTVGYPIISKEVSECIEQVRINKINGKYTYRVQRINGVAKKKDGSLSNYNIPQWKFLIDAPFKISGKCCDLLKKKPFRLYEKETGRKAITGMMASESRLRYTQWIKNGCNGFDMKKPISNPLSFWNEQDILSYLKKTEIPYSSVYGEIIEDEEIKGQKIMPGFTNNYKLTGVNRTGCMFCMFGVHLEKGQNRFEKMKITHPDIYNYCMRSKEEKGLGIKKVLEFLNINY